MLNSASDTDRPESGEWNFHLVSALRNQLSCDPVKRHKWQPEFARSLPVFAFFFLAWESHAFHCKKNKGNFANRYLRLSGPILFYFCYASAWVNETEALLSVAMLLMVCCVIKVAFITIIMSRYCLRVQRKLATVWNEFGWTKFSQISERRSNSRV